MSLWLQGYRDHGPSSNGALSSKSKSLVFSCMFYSIVAQIQTIKLLFPKMGSKGRSRAESAQPGPWKLLLRFNAFPCFI